MIKCLIKSFSPHVYPHHLLVTPTLCIAQSIVSLCQWQVKVLNALFNALAQPHTFQNGLSNCLYNLANFKLLISQLQLCPRCWCYPPQNWHFCSCQFWFCLLYLFSLYLCSMEVCKCVPNLLVNRGFSSARPWEVGVTCCLRLSVVLPKYAPYMKQHMNEMCQHMHPTWIKCVNTCTLHDEWMHASNINQQTHQAWTKVINAWPPHITCTMYGSN